MYLCLKYIYKNIERRITVESLYVRITVEFFIQGDDRKTVEYRLLQERVKFDRAKLRSKIKIRDL